MLEEQLLDQLIFVYGEEQGQVAAEALFGMLQQFKAQHPQLRQKGDGRFSQKDAILITYGDMIQERIAPPLYSLSTFLRRHLAQKINTVHILPFYPYSSDDGFSVIDYQAVNPDLGSWQDVARIGQNFRLMVDAVINHISSQSNWFQAFLADDPQYRSYFLTVDPDVNLSAVFRPRALPLLTPYETAVGLKHVWTTFSPDQIDLNYANPNLLLDVIDTLLFYVAQGAELIRLDAIAFMWKQIGTNCIHLPQTHRLIQLMRTVLDMVAPHVVLITETNVPHDQNISYFGDGSNEAQMVYNFTLPPLTLHAFHTGKATHLSQWAETLTLPSDKVTFFNFLASHDGIGLLPASEILHSREIRAMAERVQALGGYVSYKNNPDGSRSPYELNINYLDALGDPAVSQESVEQVAQRFLASQAIMLALRGVPGIYLHSLFGSRGWPEGVAESGRYRTINRQKLDRQQVELELANPRSLRYFVFYDYLQLLRHRTQEPAFHPQGGQQVIHCHEAVFALLRSSVDGRSHILCLHNVANELLDIYLDLSDLPLANTPNFTDLITNQTYTPHDDHHLILTLEPYQVVWLKAA
ncbi:MAG: sugar phosphorylase [Ardenticatenaceae bacterium]|nr:sugar phosphorylase [Ardenticatenaceae bacterium]